MNMKVTMGALAVLVALGTYVAVFEREPKDPASASKGPDEVQLLKYELADLQGFAVTTAGANLEAKRDKTDWTLAGTGKKLDNEQVESPLRSLTDLKSRTLVTELASAKDLANFGLDKPQTTIAFTWKTGADKPSALLLGKENLDKSGYYAKTRPGEGIYVIDRYAVDRVAELAKNPPLAKPSPSPSPNPAK